MFRPARRSVSSTTSTIKRTQRIVIIALAFTLALVGVALRGWIGSAAGSNPPTSQKNALPTTAQQKIDLLRMWKVYRGAGRHFSLSSPVAPSVSATKTDTLFTDVDGDLQADPGDTLKYTVNISASGEDASGVTFDDTVDPNTAFVAGSLRATPVAIDDSYAATGNIRISVAAPGVLANDFAGLPGATISAPPITSANGGNVALNADGSFTYNPPAGFEGTDTFSYTLTNSEGSNAATVTITVSGMIWFVNNTASCPCDGRLTNPFNTLSSFAAVNNGVGNNPAANDNIFLYESASDYAGPVTLLNGQRFLGQDATASLSAMTGLTPPSGSDPLPATDSGNATIVNVTTGNAITVGTGNTLRGFTGGNSTTDISGSGFGTLTISDVTLNGTGQALNLTTGTLAATFGGISSTNSATTGISLTGVAGTLTTPTTTITNPTGIGISVGTSSATLNFGNTASTLSGGTGVSLLTNSGAITFGSLNISPDASQRGLLATDNSNTITSTSGAISTSGATAVQITRGAGTTPLVIGLTSVSQTGGSNGILLTNTSGSFTVAGSGGTCTFATPTCSGGRISTTTGADGSTAGIGVSLNNVTNISLTSMRIDNHPNFGIRGHGVVGFTLQSSVVDGNNGTSATADTDLVNGEDSIRIINLTGSALIDDSFIGGGYEQNLRIVNDTGTLNRLTVSDTSIGDLDGAGPGRGVDTTNGDDDVYLESRATAVMNATFTNDILNNSRGDIIQGNALNTSTMDIVFRGNVVSNNHPSIVTGGGGATLSIGGTGSSPTMTYDVSCNTFRSAKGNALTIFKGTGAGSMSGTVFNNKIGVTGVSNSGSSQASGISIGSTGSGSHTALIKNNIILQYNEAGIIATANQGSSTLNLTAIGNTTDEPGGGGFAGFYAEAGASGSDTVAYNLKLGGAGAEQNNFVNGDPFDFNDVFMGQNAGTFNLTQGNSVSFVPDTVVMDNNVSPLTIFTYSLTVVIPAPALPVAINETCTPPARMAIPETPKQPAEIDSESAEVSKTLRAAGGENGSGEYAHKLTPSELQVMTEVAIGQWADAGASAEDIARMREVSLQIADLPEGQLATANSNEVRIDESAAGYGWYVDATPSDDSEFEVPVPNKELQTSEFSYAHGRMDLLTVIMRQLGTLRMIPESGINAAQPWLMQNTLGTGVRRAPVWKTSTLSKTGTRVQPELSKSAGSQTAKPTKKNDQKSAHRSSDGQTTSSHHATVRNPVVNNARPMASSMLSDVNLSIGTIPAGESVTITFNVTIDDPFTGGSPQVSNQGTVSGSNFADVLTDDPSVGGSADPTVTPIDLPDVSVAVSPSSVAEDGATNLVYTFTRDGSPANALTVNFSIGGTADFGASPNDYTQTGAATFTPPTGTVTFGAGNSTATVTVNPETDTTVETDETVVLTLTSGVGYVVGAPSSASGTITNDDTDVSVAVSPGSVTEDGATNLVYTFTRNGDTSGLLTVNFSVGGSANFGASPNDYTQTGAATFTPTTGSVTFTALNSTATVTINPETDTTIEPDETVILTLTSGAGYNVVSPSSATGTITNDDADVSVTVAPASVAEDGATNLVYTFTRTGFTGGPLTVNFSVGGTSVFGVSPNDYTQTGAASYTTSTGTVTFTGTNTTATVTVNPETDATAESDETVIITLTAGASYNVVSPSSATGTILNDDTLVSVAVAPSSTTEGGANMVYTFTRTGPPASALTVNFSVGGSASFPADYSQSGAATFTPPTATVTFGAGSTTKTVTVTPLIDCAIEGSETVIFTVQPGAGYGVGSPNPATGTITNTPDSTLPTITCNADVVADFNPAVGGAVVTYTAPVGSDNCPGAITTQIAGLPSGSTFPLGTTINTFRVTDLSGNTAECSFKVTVALTSIIGLDSITITGASFIDSYNSLIGYPASKTSLASVVSNGTITMGNSGKVWGSVRSTQVGINMTGASQVTGNATAGTTVSLSGSASVGGTITNNSPSPAVTLPAVPPCGPPYSPNTGISGSYTYSPSTGNLSLSGNNIATLANGNYCFNNITMGNSAQLKVNGLVTIKMTGTLNLSGNTSFTNTTGIPGNLRILSSLASGGNGVILGNGTNVTMVIYAPQTGVSISGNAPLFGTVAAKRIILGNSGAIHYDTQLKLIWPDLWTVIVGP